MEILKTGSITGSLSPPNSGRTPSAPTTEPAVNLVPAAAPEAVPPPAITKTAALQMEQVQQAVDRVKQSIKPELANSLEFQIDQSTGKTLIKILDKETNTVVRQIPSEEMMAIAEAIDRMEGRSGLVRQQV